MSSASAALGYIEEGLTVVPVPAGQKGPKLKNWEALRITADEVSKHFRNGENIGIHTGDPSGGCVVVDLDVPEAVKLAGRYLDPTKTSGRESVRDSHWWFVAPGARHSTFKDLDGSMLLELRSTGHQTLVAPSRHPSGELYSWSESGLEMATVDPDELLGRCRHLAAAVLIARNIPRSREEGGGGRHDIALALAGFMLRNDEDQDSVERILKAAWSVRGASKEALRDLDGIVEGTALRLERDEPTTGGRRLEELVQRLPGTLAKVLGWKSTDMREQRRHYAASDLGNAERFVDLYQHIARYCPARKTWLVYDGRRWRWDERREIVKLAHKAVRAIYNDASAEPDPDRQKQIVKFALGSQNEPRINAMISQASPYLAVGLEELDTDEWLLNCQNGTLDLRTGKMQEHNPADLISKIVPVDYRPGSPRPRFERFLDETLVDPAVVTFVKRFAGYTATGITRERMLAILHGSGKNGKTTLVELLQDVLGDYSKNTAVETLLIKKSETVGNEVAALKGARMVSAAEVEKNRRLAESKVKQLTGRDTVTARFLFNEPFDFRPEFKLWLSTNNKPIILGTDDAIWDRIRLIPFEQRFDDERAEPDLAEKLRAELEGVLAWIVEGCLDWQREGLEEPGQIADATRRYREEMDTLAAFIEDRCIVHPEATVAANALYEQYRMWCENSGEKRETQKMFTMRLRERGFDHDRITRGADKGRKGWSGIGIRVNPTDPEERNGAIKVSGNLSGNGSHGSPSEGRVKEGSPPENPSIAGDSSAVTPVVNPSEPKNNNLLNEEPRVRHKAGKRFTTVHSVHPDGPGPTDLDNDLPDFNESYDRKVAENVEGEWEF